MRGRSVTRRIARIVGIMLVTIVGLDLAVTLAIIEFETTTLREGLLTIGLRMLGTAARGEVLDQAALERALGDRPGFAVVTYDRSGRLLARSRGDVPVPFALDASQMDQAARTPDQAVFLEPYSLGRDNVGVMRVDAGPVAFLGIFDRWAPRRVNRAVLLGSSGGLLVAALVGFVTTRILARRLQNELSRAEAVVSRIARGSLQERLPELGDDEVGRLASSFNHMADQLEGRLSELAREQDLKRRAFSDWSHEVATPLSSVLGYLESLKTNSVDPAATGRYVQTAHEQALALKFLCDELSTLGQLDFDGLTLDVEKFDLAELAQSEAAAHEPGALKKGVALTTTLAPALIDGDRPRMAQVLRNLLSNAVRHTPSGKRIEVQTGSRDGFAWLEVRDEGEGMSQADTARLGQRFFRADVSRDRRTGGRGLGIAIAKGIVEAHAGFLEFESELHRGTRARVRLPTAAS